MKFLEKWLKANKKEELKCQVIANGIIFKLKKVKLMQQEVKYSHN